MTPSVETRERIMGVARAMVQAHGYNALSFRDVAQAVGVKSSSVHYHFPTKGDLGAALARRYADEAEAALQALSDSLGDLAACFEIYTGIFRAALADDNRMCLCGIMSAEHDDLPAEVRAEVDRFTEINLRWLDVALAGRPGREASPLREQAVAVFAAIEGAQLVARGRGDIALYDAAIRSYRATGLIP